MKYNLDLLAKSTETPLSSFKKAEKILKLLNKGCKSGKYKKFEMVG